jgi:arylsulfatase A-like enzyme
MVFAEEDHEGNVLRSIRTEQWKWIEANAGNPRGVPELELFHVAADPTEQSNVADETAWVVQELQAHAEAQQMQAEKKSVGDGAAPELTEMEKEALRSLGYLED